MNTKYAFTYIIPYIHNSNNIKLLRRLTNELVKFENIEIIIVEQGTSNSISETTVHHSKHILAYSEDLVMNAAWLCNIGSKYASTDYIVYGRFNYVIDPNAILLGVNTLINGTHDTLLLNSYYINLSEEDNKVELKDLSKIDVSKKYRANGIVDSIFVYTKKWWHDYPFIESLYGNEYNFINTNIFTSLSRTGSINESIVYKYLSYEIAEHNYDEKTIKEFTSLKTAFEQRKIDTVSKYIKNIIKRVGNENKFYITGYNS